MSVRMPGASALKVKEGTSEAVGATEQTFPTGRRTLGVRIEKCGGSAMCRYGVCEDDDLLQALP